MLPVVFCAFHNQPSSTTGLLACSSFFCYVIVTSITCTPPIPPSLRPSLGSTPQRQPCPTQPLPCTPHRLAQTSTPPAPTALLPALARRLPPPQVPLPACAVQRSADGDDGGDDSALGVSGGADSTTATDRPTDRQTAQASRVVNQSIDQYLSLQQQQELLLPAGLPACRAHGLRGPPSLPPSCLSLQALHMACLPASSASPSVA